MQSTELRIKQNPKSSILKSPHIQQKIYIHIMGYFTLLQRINREFYLLSVNISCDS